MKKAFPYKQWRLMPSFKPVQVEIVRSNDDYWRKGYPVDSRGKVYDRDELFNSKAEAIAYGREVLFKQKADIDKRVATLIKKQAALDKAEGAAA